MTRAEYMRATEYVVSAIGRLFTGPCIETRCLDNKESFGDLDLVIAVENYDGNLVQHIALHLLAVEIAGNSIGVPFEGRIIQVDINIAPPQLFHQVVTNLSYGVFGMYVGLCLSKYDLSYGAKGLSIRVNNSCLLLSTNAQDIFEFLGYDYRRFERGFADEAALFAFILESPFAHVDFMKNCKRGANAANAASSASRAYDKYKTFDHKLLSVKYHTVKMCPDIVRRAALTFFNKHNDYEAYINECARVRAVAEKFNGNIVASLTGLYGPVLGDFMIKFKRGHDVERLYGMSGPDIRRAIMKAHAQEILE